MASQKAKAGRPPQPKRLSQRPAEVEKKVQPVKKQDTPSSKKKAESGTGTNSESDDEEESEEEESEQSEMDDNKVGDVGGGFFSA